MLSISRYARRRGVHPSTARRWVLSVVGELSPGERREIVLADGFELPELPEVELVERTPGGHYRLKIRSPLLK